MQRQTCLSFSGNSNLFFYIKNYNISALQYGEHYCGAITYVAAQVLTNFSDEPVSTSPLMMETAECYERVLTFYQTTPQYGMLGHNLNTGSSINVQPINTRAVFSILQHVLQ
jgi:hypothetical protein